jgi:energy-coupling factor transporter ATP-binding protein EcfA2
VLLAIGVIIAAVATFAVLVSTQDITVEAKPSESITIDGLSPQGDSTLAVACSTFLEPCKITDSQNRIKTVEAKPSESVTTNGLSPQGDSTLAVACSTFLEPCKITDSQNRIKTVEAKPSESITTNGLSPQGESTLAEVVAGSME